MAYTNNSRYTQCNFFVKLRTNKHVQTTGSSKRTTGTQTYKSINSSSASSNPIVLEAIENLLSVKKLKGPTQRSTTTQCNFELKPFSKNACVQVKPTTEDKGVQLAPSTIANKQFSKLEDIIVSFDLPLTHHFQSTSRGEDVIVVTNPSDLGLLGEDVELARAVISTSGKCTLIVPFLPVETVNIFQQGCVVTDSFILILKKIAGQGYVFCPGLKKTTDREHLSSKLVVLSQPFHRVQSINCKVLFETRLQRSRVMQCTACQAGSSLVRKSFKRKLRETPTRAQKRLKADSNYSISALTPTRRAHRLKSLRKARQSLQLKVTKLKKRLAEREIVLNDSQSKELETLVHKMNNEHTDDVEAAIQASSNPEILKEIWKKDSEVSHQKDMKLFSTDQGKCANGSKGNRWSSISIRIALAVYCRSPAAYRALKSFDMLKLPSEDTLKRKTNKFDCPPGENHEYVFQQAAKYEAYITERNTIGLPEPKGEGVLIFDEVKVIEKVIWNSKNHEFKGFAMDQDEFLLLNDILQQTPTMPAPTQYVLQFLWRDLTSDFDLLGPYFTFASSVTSDKLLSCIMQVMSFLSHYSFHTMALVCDGASDNLKTIKQTMGLKGAFENVSGDMEFTIDPSFDNPFRRDRKVYWIVCPTHQLKNMVSALHSSRDKGTKDFSRDGNYFGWKNIQAVKKRDEARIREGKMRTVPRLLPKYIIRDSWTKLNVKPSKIMQQECLLSELYAFSEGTDGNTVERQSALECYLYLKACNQLFENGFLSKSAIRSVNEKCMLSIQTGYTYFTDWLKELLDVVPKPNLKAPKQSVFLSWQTWDLLRICVFGFKSLVEDFTKRHPMHFISPVRLNGSAIESLYSQMKYATGSKLSGINYSTAKKAVTTRSNIHGRNSCNKGYRDVHLYIRENDL